MKSTSFIKLALSFVVLIITRPAFAGDVAVDWSHTLLFNDLLTAEPRMRVGFYPPDKIPPSTLDLSDPSTVVMTYSSTNPASHLLFATTGADVFAPREPNKDGHYEFQVLNISGDPESIVELDITTSSGGAPIPSSWVSFNPQPEPPALLDGAAAIGFDYNLSSLSDVTLSLRVLDLQGNPQSFSAVPVPAAVWLFGTGLLAMLNFRSRKIA
jgi:hypothetical protein